MAGDTALADSHIHAVSWQHDTLPSGTRVDTASWQHDTLLYAHVSGCNSTLMRPTGNVSCPLYTQTHISPQQPFKTHYEWGIEQILALYGHTAGYGDKMFTSTWGLCSTMLKWSFRLKSAHPRLDQMRKQPFKTHYEWGIEF